MGSKKEKEARRRAEQDEQESRRAKYQKDRAEYKQLTAPLVRFLRENKLTFSHATINGVRIQYFRLDEYEKLLLEKKSEIEQNQPLAKLIKEPKKVFNYYRRPKQLTAKYPKLLEPATDNDRKYGSFMFDTTESKRSKVILVICLVLLAVLFPIWPYELKYAVWLISLVLLVAIVGLIVLRLLVCMVSTIFGYDLWIFPNFMASKGVLDSFIPFYSVQKNERDLYNNLIRVIAICLFLGLSMHIYLTPNFLEDMTKSLVKDIHDWGVNKLNNTGNFSQRALSNLNHILNITEESDSTNFTEGDL